jgi:7,8-dihydropterin-6-yl-methyl-4-(beta-D-ribofuranosyl)aminobenzene 5'-phosphate synthase
VQLTVLVDNNTFIDKYYRGEPAVSYFLEADGQRVLFDLGYSGLFIENARKMGIDLLDVDLIVLSHGHLDHTWGILSFIRMSTEAAFEGRTVKRPRLVAHPDVLRRKRHRDIPEIGLPLAEDSLASYFDLRLSREPVRLTERLTFLGEIERRNAFEAQETIGTVVDGTTETEDDLRDDTALAYGSGEGLVVITGCAHAGICNVVEYARRTCGERRIADIVGGFHLLAPSRERLEATIRYLESVAPRRVHAGHCTDLKSRTEMARSLPLEELGVGLRLEYPGG